MQEVLFVRLARECVSAWPPPSIARSVRKHRPSVRGRAAAFGGIASRTCCRWRQIRWLR